jgi:hypothetical protein
MLTSSSRLKRSSKGTCCHIISKIDHPTLDFFFVEAHLSDQFRRSVIWQVGRGKKVGENARVGQDT